MRVQHLVWPLLGLLWTVGSNSNQDSQEDDSSSNVSTIPLIDLESWMTTTSQLQSFDDDEQTLLRRRKVMVVVEKIRKAVQDTGFFAIYNHGVNTTRIQIASRDFFDLSLEEKQRYTSLNQMEYPYGYEHSERLSIGHSLTDDTSQRRSHNNNNDDDDTVAPDWKETFAIGPSNPDSGMPPRRFPDHSETFRVALEDYYSDMETLATRLFQLFALALELPQDWFLSKFDQHQCALRLLNYPSISSSSSSNDHQDDNDDDDDNTRLGPIIRAGAHTDYGAFTILKSGGPGLQLFQSNQWIDVPFLEDAFIINIGDLMQRWTNDKWVSTLHRVVVPFSSHEEGRRRQQQRRMSIAFFVNMNANAQIEPILHKNDHDDELPKYPPILAGDHLMAKHLASMLYDNHHHHHHHHDEL